MHIRMEQNQDIPAIRSLIQVAFQDAPNTSHTEHLIVEALRHAHMLTISLVAEAEGRIVGHVAASPVSISSGAQIGMAWGLYQCFQKNKGKAWAVV